MDSPQGIRRHALWSTDGVRWSTIILNIAEMQKDSVEIADVLLLFDLASVFGFTAGDESFHIFKRAIEDAKKEREERRRHMDEYETI